MNMVVNIECVDLFHDLTLLHSPMLYSSVETTVIIICVSGIVGD